MPLSSSVLVNQDEVLEIVEEMKRALPEEIKQARWVVKDREELLGKARGEAEQIVEAARAEQLKMAQKEEIVERAKQEAERILEAADDEARTMRSEGEDYVDAKLAQFENVLRKVSEDLTDSSQQIVRTIESVQAGRERLRSGTVAEQEFGTASDAPSADGVEQPEVVSQEIDLDLGVPEER
jgi:vacuolar-type H+-ATPase subunit H